MDVGITWEYGNRTGFLGDLAEPSGVTSNSLVARTGFEPVFPVRHALAVSYQAVKGQGAESLAGSGPLVCWIRDLMLLGSVR